MARRPSPLNSLLLHFRPAEVPERTLRFTLTWGLGGMATVLVFVLFATGLLLKFVFEPVPERAYESILYLQQQVPFGQLIRNIHRWSGNTLVLLAFLHSLRVFYTAATDPGRRANWLIGMGLFVFVVLANFTGYLLPWDQIAFWAITVSSSMLDYLPIAGASIKAWLLGGTEPGPATLLTFYALHTAVLPALMLLVLPFHFWRVRKAGGLVVPRRPDEASLASPQMVPVVPHLLTRELALTLLLLAALLLFAMVANAPLAGPANPGLSPNPTKAPWYFMGLQELLLHLHPLFSVVVVPALLMAGIVLLPWLSADELAAGIWFRSRRGRRSTLFAAGVAVLLTVGAVFWDEALRANGAAGAPGLVNRGVLPVTLIATGCGAYALVLSRLFGATRGEWVQALFTLAVAALVTLTVIGTWFRGQGMQLVWGAG